MKFDSHVTASRRVEGWVELGTAVRVCSLCPRLYIAVVINTTAWGEIPTWVRRATTRWLRPVYLQFLLLLSQRAHAVSDCPAWPQEGYPSGRAHQNFAPAILPVKENPAYACSAEKWPLNQYVPFHVLLLGHLRQNRGTCLIATSDLNLIYAVNCIPRCPIVLVIQYAVYCYWLMISAWIWLNWGCRMQKADHGVLCFVLLSVN